MMGYKICVHREKCDQDKTMGVKARQVASAKTNHASNLVLLEVSVQIDFVTSAPNEHTEMLY